MQLPRPLPVGIGLLHGGRRDRPGGGFGNTQPSATTSLLLVLGGELTLASVVAPWFRYVRSDGGRLSALDVAIGVGGGLIVTGLLLLIAVFAVFRFASQCD